MVAANYMGRRAKRQEGGVGDGGVGDGGVGDGGVGDGGDGGEGGEAIQGNMRDN
ncbi:uncharacterized protein FFMR_13017 [Fusarium fujikuroi]|nr:uncharacterized protein FFMR_13017 [Fusarium fujikuroi]